MPIILDLEGCLLLIILLIVLWKVQARLLKQSKAISLWQFWKEATPTLLLVGVITSAVFFLIIRVYQLFSQLVLGRFASWWDSFAITFL